MRPPVDEQNTRAVFAGEALGQHAAGESGADDQEVEHRLRPKARRSAPRARSSECSRDMTASISEAMQSQSCAATRRAARARHCRSASLVRVNTDSAAATNSSPVGDLDGVAVERDDVGNRGRDDRLATRQVLERLVGDIARVASLRAKGMSATSKHARNAGRSS